MKNWKYWIPFYGLTAWKNAINMNPLTSALIYVWQIWIVPICIVLLFAACCEKCSAQTFTQVGQLPNVCTDIDFDQQGRIWLTRKQGVLYCNYDTVATFPVQQANECGLVGLEMNGQYAYLHISGQDSVQRVIRYDTISYETDTIIEVPYKAPFSNRHRGGDIFVQDTFLYCSFGYGFRTADAQDLDDYRGKLLKVNLNTLAVDIVVFGLRNPYRFDFIPKWNEGFIADVGSDFAEEINYFTGDYSLLNNGWPCYEGTIQLLDPDTLCDGYSLSFPEFSYVQAQPRSITGGCFFEGNYYFCDHFKDPDTINYVFGGYIDTNWVFNQLPVSFPENVTAMTVNPNTSTLTLSTVGGKIYEMEDLPLGIDPDSLPPKGTLMKGIYCYNGGITWEDGLVGTLRVFSLEGRVVYSVDLLQEEGFWFEDLPPGFYILAVYTARGIQYSKAFVKIRT